MSTAIGFVLLTHTKPDQIHRLIAKLNTMFNFPPIVCHHNFSISNLPVDTLPRNVLLVRPHIQTEWSKFSVVEAMLQALKLMLESPASPDWIILLSGSDYPIKSAKKILHDLASSSYDVHINYEQIKFNSYERDWQKLCYLRYCSIKLKFPFLKKKLYLQHPLITSPFLPFSKELRCFAGEHWFSANRKAIKYLLEFHATQPALATHYRKLDSSVIFPDESYYHTIFCNAPHLKVQNNHWRYIDWSTNDAHPKILVLEDLPNLLASTAHFARKFDLAEDSVILDKLDEITLE